LLGNLKIWPWGKLSRCIGATDASPYENKTILSRTNLSRTKYGKYFSNKCALHSTATASYTSVVGNTEMWLLRVVIALAAILKYE